MEVIRVLHVLGTLNLGGAESRIMDLYRNIDREKVQFDFLIHDSGQQHYEEEVKALGGRIYRLPRFRGYNYMAYKKAIHTFFKNHTEIKVVHGHMTSTASLYLPVAKKYGVSMTIAHARSAGVDKGLKGKITMFLRKNLVKKADYCFTCSGLAGEAVFGKEAMTEGRVQLIPNAIEVEKYKFSAAVREKIRKELCLEDQFVVGHVGRFSFMKNHKFLLEVFAEIVKKEDNSILLLLGEGEYMDEMKAMAAKMKLEKKVLFLGNKKNVHEFYQAMDYFIFPSLFEGLPGTVLEAQASALPCLISDSITKEVMVMPLVKSFSLEKKQKEWADFVLEERKKWKREEEKEAAQTGIKAAGFDVKTQGREMMSFYKTAEKKRLMLMVPMLHQGGFERVCVLTARLLKEDYQVFLCVFDLSDLAYDIKGLPVFHLALGAKNTKAGKILNVVKRCYKVSQLKKKMKIDVTYSFGPTANLVNVLSSKGCSGNHSGKIWCGIRSYMDLDSSNYRMMKLFCDRADKVVSCSKVIEEEIKETYSCRDITTLYNPYDRDSIQMQSQEKIEDSFFEGFQEGSLLVCSMGREDDIKGFWHLLKAFSFVEKEVRNMKKEAGLFIIGDGDFTEYKQLAGELGISDCVYFTGLKKNPYPYLKKADIYVLSSYHEGFPNALVEAMTLGIPVIATDCKTGPEEILKDKYGILIPNMSPKKNMDARCFEEGEKQLAEKILALWQKRETYDHYIKMSEERSSHFSFEAYRKQFCEMMEGQ